MILDAADFERIFDTAPTLRCFAPGRVNLIGEHTDYNGGFVMPLALGLGIECLACAREDAVLRLYSRDVPKAGVVEVDLKRLGKTRRWADYPVGVVRAMAAFGYPLNRGADLYFGGTVPGGSGLSSSAALEVVTALTLSRLFDLPLSGQELALIGQFAENRFIGVSCGIMDQFASAMGRRGKAVLLDTQTLEYSYAPVENSRAVLILVNSMVKHSLANSAYNDRRRECEAALTALQSKKRRAALCDYTPEDFERLQDCIADKTVRRRAKHAISENARTYRAAQALRTGNLRELGRLMNASHRSLRDDYEVSCRELDFLAATAQKTDGVLGARMTGGGFGGCTINLVETDKAEAFKRTIVKAYRDRFGKTPDVLDVTYGEAGGFELMNNEE